MAEGIQSSVVNANTGGGSGGVTSLNTLSGAVTLSAGTNVTLTPVGNDIQISATAGGGGVATVTATAPVTSSGGSNPDIAMAKSTTSIDGYLAATDFTTFNNKVSATRAINTTAPLTGGGNLSADRTLSIPKSTTSVDGYLAATDFTTFNNKQPSGNYITDLTGDATATGPGSASLTLATVMASPNNYGQANQVGAFTVNGKGLITAASNIPIQIGESQVTNLVSDLAGKQPTGNYITALTGDVTATGPGSVAATIASNAITNAKLAQMAAHTIKGNNTGSTGNALDLTGTQVTAELDTFTTTLKGLVPPPTTVVGNVLADSGTWVPQSAGSSNYNVTSKTADYTLLSTDTVVLGDSSGSTFTLTLPLASSVSGKFYIIKKTDTSLIELIIAADVADTIEGVATKSMFTGGEVYIIFSDGINTWYVQEHQTETNWTTFTPTGSWTTNTSYDGVWKREGDTMRARIGVTLSGAPNATSLTITTPLSQQIDTTKITNLGNTSIFFGYGQANSGAAQFPIVCRFMNSSTSDLAVQGAIGVYVDEPAVLDNSVPFAAGAGTTVFVDMVIPIQGWET